MTDESNFIFPRGRIIPPGARWEQTLPKVFILGVGAQKSGTTWLHQYLQRHPNANMGFAKEYHIFDALYVNEVGIRKKWFQDRISKFSNPLTRMTESDIFTAKFLSNTEFYFDYFEMLANSRTDTILTGDITPSYAINQIVGLIK